MSSKPRMSVTRQALRCVHGQKRTAAGQFVRCMATEVSSSTSYPASSESMIQSKRKSIFARAKPAGSPSQDYILPLQHIPPPNPFITSAQCMLYSFPSFEPIQFTAYPSTHLLLPLRKDLLHRAVVFEADAARSGTASTKWRDDVHGSGRKIRPQKGSGRARLGDKKSPMLRGGGVAFGPRPRDFSTEMNRKMYDLAWRVALSYRYRRGQLTVLKGGADLSKIGADSRARYMAELLRHHEMGHEQRRTLLITNHANESLDQAFEEEKTRWEGNSLEVNDVKVKDLLELGRIVIEQSALERVLLDHESDLPPWQQLAEWTKRQRQMPTPSVSITTSV